MRGGSLTKCLRKYPWDWPVINHLRIPRAGYARNYVSRDPPSTETKLHQGLLNELLFFTGIPRYFRRGIDTLPWMIYSSARKYGEMQVGNTWQPF